jgi:hypothetical protein
MIVMSIAEEGRHGPGVGADGSIPESQTRERKQHTEDGPNLNIPPPIRPHFLILSNSSIRQGAGIQTHESGLRIPNNNE